MIVEDQTSKTPTPESEIISPTPPEPAKNVSLSNPVDPNPTPPCIDMGPPSRGRTLSLPYLRRREPSAAEHMRRRTQSVPPKRGSAPYRLGAKCCQVPDNVLDSCSHGVKALATPLLRAKFLGGKSIEDPINFPDAPLSLTVIRKRNPSAKGHSPQVWELIQEAVNAFPSLRMADWTDPSLEPMQKKCRGRIPILVHPTLYRAIKLTFPLDVGRLALNKNLTDYMRSGDMGPSVTSIGPEHFRAIDDTTKQ